VKRILWNIRNMICDYLFSLAERIRPYRPITVAEIIREMEETLPENITLERSESNPCLFFYNET